MNAIARTSLSAGAGAAAMFLLDPGRGSRRRALIRDKVVFAGRKTRDAAGATRRDLQNRWQGATARVQSLLGRDEPGDRVICERVRAELGRVASHPRAICVTADGGNVTLTGDVLASEVPSIVSHVGNVRGVQAVDNQMAAHQSAEGIPSLQGESERPGQWSTWLRSSWSPSAVLAAGVAAAAVAAAIPTLTSRRSTVIGRP